MTKIFFDMDGTLIDSKKRLYSLFQDLVPESKLSFEDYWKLKRSKISHKQILKEQFGYSEKLFLDFEKIWLDFIEIEQYLEMDNVFTGVQSTLRELRRNCILNLITARQSIEMTHWQLKKIELYDFFDNIFVTRHKVSKEDLILQRCLVSNIDYLVGDTGYDILTGKKIGVKTIAVSYGFLATEKLIEYNPDFIIDDFSKIKDVIYGRN